VDAAQFVEDLLRLSASISPSITIITQGKFEGYYVSIVTEGLSDDTAESLMAWAYSEGQHNT
jgi:hypothetical protein